MLLFIAFASLLVGSQGFVPRVPAPNSRILGSVPTSIEDHPYQVSVQVSGVHICGGSIISNRFVLTAAHCTLFPAHAYSVVAGTSSVKSGGTVYKVLYAIPHENFDPRNFDMDIGILIVDREIEFNALIQPIDLGSTEPEPNTLVNVTGWGYDLITGEVAEKLQQMTVPIVSRENCRALTHGNITENMICAGVKDSGKDVCIGDGGGPMTGPDNKLYGIVSVYACAYPSYSSIYVNVANLGKWMKAVVARM